MDGLLEGKAGLVTGAARGIGRASALVAAANGAGVVVSDLASMEDEGRETVALVEKEGGTAVWAACDVTSSDDQRALVAAVVERFGSLDFAHNNAGIVIEGLIPDIDEEDFDRVLAVNTKGIWLGMKYQIPEMVRRGGGAIVNTASLAGLIAAPSAGSYVASKHAVVGLTKTAAVEWAEHGVRVNAICPAATRTPMLESQPPERQALLVAPQAIKRMADPTEIADVVTWLCSGRSSFMTGVAVPVDAGALAF